MDSSAYEVLAAAQRLGQATVGQLAVELRVGTPTARRRVAALADEGLVFERRSAGRTVVVADDDAIRRLLRRKSAARRGGR